jgi:transposase
MTDHAQAMLFSQDELDALRPQPTPADAAHPQLAAASDATGGADATPAQSDRKARINRPERFQGEMYTESLDQRLDADHEARVVWDIVLGLDLSPLYRRIDAVEGVAGRNASDPRVLFALWLYAAVNGVGSARRLERLCHEHRAYEWLRGGVPVNHHMLSDFRVQHGALLKQIQTDSLASMLTEGLISLETASQDGMRVRANAGSHSFRRLPTLEEAQRQAREHLDKLEREADEDPDLTSRQKKAKERAARERSERVAKAIDAVKEMAQQREKRKKGDGASARASTTDPDARRMKMGDGGYRPAVNMQMATDTQSGIILGMDVISEGSDAGQMKPMMDDIKESLGEAPKNLLVDGGFATHDDIEATEQGGTTVYAPVKEEEKQRKAGKDPFAAKEGDSPIIAAYRQRMGTDAAKELYKLRAATAELSNARLRNQGIYQLPVRGLAKIKAVLWWHVLAVNLLRARILRAARQMAPATPALTGDFGK